MEADYLPMEVEDRRKSSWKDTAIKVAPYFGIGVVVFAIAVALIARDVTRTNGASRALVTHSILMPLFSKQSRVFNFRFQGYSSRHPKIFRFCPR
jgi:uncharacterized membrane protein YagU involved in acid resistance